MSTALLGQPAPVDDATRRQFLAGVTAAALLAGCGNDSSTSEGSAGPVGWSFTDDRGETITLPARPQRIAMQEDAAGALLPFGIRPIAVFGNDLITESPQFEGIDITGIEQFGAEYGVIDLERLAALDPDLIVVPLYPDGPGGFQDRAQSDLAAQIAPTWT